jgi:hypothetical protein
MALNLSQIGGIASSGLGAIGGLFGGLGKRAAIKKMIRQLEAKKRENQNWYDRRYNEDATQRADAQSLLTNVEDSIKKRNRQAAGTAAVMGGNAESVAAEKEANAKALTDTTSQIAEAADKRKDAIEQQYRAKNDALDAQIAELEGQKPSGFDIASGVVGGAAGGMDKIFG